MNYKSILLYFISALMQQRDRSGLFVLKYYIYMIKQFLISIEFPTRSHSTMAALEPVLIIYPGTRKTPAFSHSNSVYSHLH